MVPNNQKNIPKIVSLIVTASSVMVMIGWILDIGVLKSISPDWVTMKFDTAIAFFLSGITLYFIVRAQEGYFDQAQVVLSITSLLIILLMGILFCSTLLHIQTGIEGLFIQEAAGIPKTVIPGRPSFPTMANFILIAIAGVLTILNLKKLELKLRTIGFIVAVIGGSAMAGYVINAPLLYYYLPGINSAMACHTALLFFLTGIGLLCL